MTAPSNLRSKMDMTNSRLGPPSINSLSNWVIDHIIAKKNRIVFNLTSTMSLLKSISRRTILEDVIRGSFSESKRSEIQWRVLVLDRFASKIASNCCTMQDIASEGVTIVEDLHKKREPLPFLEAVYFLQPNGPSMECLLRDLNSSPPLYKAFHVFFVEICEPEAFEKLSEVTNMNRMKTLKEVNLSYIPYESNVFLLDNENVRNDGSFNRLFYKHTDDGLDGPTRSAIETIAGQIANLCASLGENPAVRYRAANNRNAILAKAVDEKLQEYKKVEPTLGEGSDKARSQLIILDRGFDCTTPILHELTFEAMVHDLLPIVNNTYKNKGVNGDEKDIYLDESDESWRKLKHMHIAEVSQKVSEEYKKFVESKNVSMKDGEQVGFRDLQMMVKKLPQYQKELTMFSTQINMAADCMKAFQRVEKLCAVEQDLATGVDSEGEKLRDVMSQMNPILLDMDRQTGYNDYEKLRVILLYIISKNGIAEESLDKLLSHANVDSTRRRIVTNLSFLGPNVLINGGVRKDLYHMERKNRDSEDTRYKLSRWIPILKDVIEFAIDERLDTKGFPYQSNRGKDTGYKQPTSTRYGNWSVPKTGNQARSVPRLIVFITGGITFSEIRSVYEINRSQKDWEIVLGSTEVISPNAFLDTLDTLTE